MKWEVGKEYKTRDGSRVRIYATDSGTSNQIHGAILRESFWVAEIWELDGTHPYAREHKFDLTEEEWVEPKRWLAYLWADKEQPIAHISYFYETPSEKCWQRAPWLDPPEGWSPSKESSE